MLLKFEIIWIRIGEVIWLHSDFNFSETLCTSPMISKFLKYPVYIIEYNILFIFDDAKS